MAEIIAASSTLKELFDNIERAGGIKKGNGKMQDLEKLKLETEIPADATLSAVEAMINLAPAIISLVTKTDGFRVKFAELYLKKLHARKAELQKQGLN